MAYKTMHRLPVAAAALHFDYGGDTFARDIATRLSQDGPKSRALMALTMTRFERDVHGGVEDWIDYSPLHHVVLVDGVNINHAIDNARSAYEYELRQAPEGQLAERAEAACVALVLLAGAKALLGNQLPQRGLTTRELASVQGLVSPAEGAR